MITAPESFLCPITQDVMHDPVISSDGYTYEKDAITLHLRSSPLSPMTRQAVDTNALIPNRALKDTISEWLVANPDYETTAPALAGQDPGKEPVQFSVTLCLKDEVCVKDYSQDVLCMIVDVSGSMSSAPVLKDLSGAAIQGANLTKLEMVRHAVKVAVTSLPLGTHIGIMAYDHDVEELVPFTQISTESDRANIINEVCKMETHGCTDIYKALDFSAQATIRYCEGKNTIRSGASKKMWLLTDGLPYNPNMPVKKGSEIIEAFEFLATTQKLVRDLQISTFGFGSGSQIETAVLEQLARLTGGSFGYIPDPSMLACNINGRNANDAMSISNEVVDVSFPKGYSMECVGGSTVKESTTEDKRVVSIKLRGAFKKGIPRHVHFTLFKDVGSSSTSGASNAAPPTLSCTVDDKRLTSRVDPILSLDALKDLLDDDAADLDASNVDLTLSVLCAFVGALSKKSVDMINCVIDFVDSVRGKPQVQKRESDYEYLLAIMHDAKEGKKACEPQYWEAWGVHYLRALLSAYECEESLSSRDLGTIALFVNKSDDMKNAVATMEDKFKSLTIQSTRKISQATVARYADARSSGCFTPMTLVKMADGSFLPIGSLTAGMMVMSQPVQSGSSQTRGTSPAKIMTVVETKLIGEGTQEVVQVCEGAFATPYHPVKVTLDNGPGGWVFPKDMRATGNQAMPGSFTSVFDLVLDKSHTIFVGDGSAQAITMAHGYEHGVLKHPFFGTNKCLDHLYSSYVEAAPPHVVIQQGSFVREVTLEDPDGQIVGVLAPMVAVC